MFRKRPATHTHRWITVSCKTGYRTTNLYGGKLDATILLQRCTCGAHNTSHIDGNWTREELGIDDKTIANLKDLLNDLTEDNNG